MISSMFGAPFGGTISGGHQGVDCWASRLMTPPNGGASAGNDCPLMVEVALGLPSSPVTCCWASAAAATWRVEMPISAENKDFVICAAPPRRAHTPGRIARGEFCAQE